MAPRKRKTRSLLTLPREIRDQIYENVLSEDTPIAIDQHPDGAICRAPGQSPLGLLLACKTISHEAARVFYRNEFDFVEGNWVDLLRFLLQIGPNIQHLRRVALHEIGAIMPVDEKAGLFIIPLSGSQVSSVKGWDPLARKFVRPFTQNGKRFMHYVDNNARSCFKLLNESSVEILFRAEGVPETGPAKFYDALRRNFAPAVRLSWVGTITETLFTKSLPELGQKGWKFTQAHRLRTRPAKITFTMTITGEKHHQPNIVRAGSTQRLTFSAQSATWDGQHLIFAELADKLPLAHASLFENMCGIALISDPSVLPFDSLPHDERPAKATRGWWAGASFVRACEPLHRNFEAFMRAHGETIGTFLSAVEMIELKLYTYSILLAPHPIRPAAVNVTTRWANTATLRSVFFNEQGIQLVLDGYAEQLPPPLIPLFAIYIALLQPFTDLLLVVTGQETWQTLSLDVRSHLWRHGSKIWSPADARANFLRGSEMLLGVALPTRAWQEIMRHIARNRAQAGPLKLEENYD